jgi:transposase
MSDDKYVGMDVHQASCVIEVINSAGKTIMQTIIETKEKSIRAFFEGLRGTIHVTFEEGTQAAWLYDIIKPLVHRVVVCDPRHNKLLSVGNKGDKVDCHRLAHLLRNGSLKSVYHGEKSTKALKELAHVYERLVADCTRVMNRIKAIYRGRGIPSGGPLVYHSSEREQWLVQIKEPGAMKRAILLYNELDAIKPLRVEAGREMLREARKHKAYKLLMTIPTLGRIRVALLIAAVASPHRFRTKREFWTYAGLAVVMRGSSEYQFVDGRIVRRRKALATRGLNRNYNRTVKRIFKSAAVHAIREEPFKRYYEALVKRGLAPEIARVCVSRKLAAVALTIWKHEVEFDVDDLRIADNT